MKKVLFVPGFGEDMPSRNYAAVLAMLRQANYHPQFVPIHWKHKTINGWSAELLAVYQKHAAKNVVLAGFSYGAMAALAVAAKRPPAALWLCSLSPYFAEDIACLKPRWKQLAGKRRMTAFQNLSCAELIAAVRCPTLLFAGANEESLLLDRSRAVARNVPGAQLRIALGAGHDITTPAYIAAMKVAIA